MIRCFDMASVLSIHFPFRLGKTHLSGLRSLENIVNWTVLMENQSYSTHHTGVT